MMELHCYDVFSDTERISHVDGVHVNANALRDVGCCTLACCDGGRDGTLIATLLVDKRDPDYGHWRDAADGWLFTDWWLEA